MLVKTEYSYYMPAWERGHPWAIMCLLPKPVLASFPDNYSYCSESCEAEVVQGTSLKPVYNNCFIAQPIIKEYQLMQLRTARTAWSDWTRLCGPCIAAIAGD